MRVSPFSSASASASASAALVLALFTQPALAGLLTHPAAVPGVAQPKVAAVQRVADSAEAGAPASAFSVMLASNVDAAPTRPTQPTQPTRPAASPRDQVGPPSVVVAVAEGQDADASEMPRMIALLLAGLAVIGYVGRRGRN